MFDPLSQDTPTYGKALAVSSACRHHNCLRKHPPSFFSIDDLSDFEDLRSDRYMLLVSLARPTLSLAITYLSMMMMPI